MTNTDDVIGRIDATLGTVTADPVSADAMRCQPDATRPDFAALLVPADLAEPIRLVDLDGQALAGARRFIGCQLISKLTVYGAGDVSTDFLFDDEGALYDGAVLNQRATELIHVLKAAQFTGEYPAPADLRPQDLATDAEAWRRHVRLVGTVVIIGADERTGDFVPVPQRLLEFLTEALDVDLADGPTSQGG
ncbi:hypothetical protein [Krasilnikovia sp. MM14-A1259]|uniref:hypothetical protein n=1 Tax=Krasilnikovia sp. MM14-A1259 TaxID=3373539 RepID=UPI00382EFFEF